MDIKIPFLGDGIDSATVLSIMVKEGDQVQADQTILELETDKATAPVPADASGTVQKILVKEGDAVSQGTTVVQLAGGGNGTAAAQSAPAQTVAVQPIASPTAPAPVPQSAPAPTTSANYVYQSTSGFPPPASPTIRKIAQQIGLDLARVPGSQSGGRITLEDVQRYIQALQAGTVQAAPASTATVSQASVSDKKPLPDFSKWGPVKIEKASSLRKKIAANLQASWNTAPHVAQFDEANITQLMGLRKKYNPDYEKEGVKLTLTIFALKAVIAALKKYPNFNASYDEVTGEVIYKNYYHIGVAVDTENGLMVPVIRDVDRKSLLELALELEELAQKARARQIKVEEMQGGTFTITNLGGFGVSHFTPIINAPEVAILSLGRGKLKPVVEDKKITTGIVMPLGVSYDHRLIDGADGARFVREIVTSFENFEENWVRLSKTSSKKQTTVKKKSTKKGKKK